MQRTAVEAVYFVEAAAATGPNGSAEAAARAMHRAFSTAGAGGGATLLPALVAIDVQRRVPFRRVL